MRSGAAGSTGRRYKKAAFDEAALAQAAEQPKVERAMGIEPTSSAWEAEVMAIIRRPQNAQFYRGLGGDGKRWIRRLA